MQDLGIKVIFEGINFTRLLGGLLVTARIAFISIVFSTIFGIVLGVVMTSTKKTIVVVTRVYLDAVRIIPILVWLFLFYFGLPRLAGIHLEGEFCAILVFTLWGTAEMGDIVRGSITSLPKQQKESGIAIGLSSLQIYGYIIIPLAIRRLIPAAINLATRMIKTTSLVVLIGVVEVVKVGQQIIEASVLKNPSATFWVYGFIFFLYFIICYPISCLSKRLENRWQN